MNLLKGAMPFLLILISLSINANSVKTNISFPTTSFHQISKTKVSKKAFEDANCKMLTLSNYHALINQAFADEFIQRKDLDSLKAWRTDPANWKK